MDAAGEVELGEGGGWSLGLEAQPNSLTTVTARVGQSASKGSDTSGKVWSVYLSEAERQDRALAENWKGDTEGILIFVRMIVLSDSPLPRL
jgi:hypothetical protein